MKKNTYKIIEKRIADYLIEQVVFGFSYVVRISKSDSLLLFLDNFSKKTITLLLIIGLGFSQLGLFKIEQTYAYYSDVGKSIGNEFSAGYIDIELGGTEFYSTTTAISLTPGDIVKKEITVFPDESNPFKYTASTTNITGDLDFCNALNLRAEVEGVEIYQGFLSNFLSNATTTLDLWGFDLGMGTSNFQNSICNFDFEFKGSQTRHDLQLGVGYSDTEKEENSVASWGLRINKVYYDVGRKIEEKEKPEQNQCGALSQGYWRNNEGCSQGTGSSDWASEINILSSTFSGVFATSSGADMCVVFHIPSCPSGNTVASKLCKAKNKVLADEANVVSGKLDLNAILSGSDDGDSSFDNLGLSSLSTIQEAFIILEQGLANDSATRDELVDIGYVAERIYSFYEDENPDTPYCIYEEDLTIIEEVEGENEWVEIYNQTNVSLDISGWEICDNNSCDIIPTSDLIPAMGYGVITATSTTWDYWYVPDGVIKIILDGNEIGNGLNNNGDALYLKRPDGVIVDEMSWQGNTDVWNPGAMDVAEGNVLARVPNGYDTNQPSNWVELVPPEVDFIYPDENGSYTWYWTQSYELQWTATNQNGDDNDLIIDLYYIRDDNDDNKISEGDSRHGIVKGTENDGSYFWTLPSGFAGYIWLEVVATGPENPMLNAKTVSGDIWDPMPLLVLPYQTEDFDLASIDIEAPDVTVVGNNPAYVEIGANYSDLGATVVDNVNDNLGVIAEGEVDVNTEGIYEVIYKATDQMGNVGTASRFVVVGKPEIIKEADSLQPTVDSYEEEIIQTSVEELIASPIVVTGGIHASVEIIEEDPVFCSPSSEEEIDTITQEIIEGAEEGISESETATPKTEDLTFETPSFNEESLATTTPGIIEEDMSMAPLEIVLDLATSTLEEVPEVTTTSTSEIEVVAPDVIIEEVFLSVEEETEIIKKEEESEEIIESEII
ncbi:hypothetical protein A2442_00245 [Candidatus Campbellbacteria bacterium RIFOXYC2_FULL_35_25]|uniref:LTD domain-containing protein n=1 Tax=Candidatus Campbellbacteria bacterium RIFOXYC2_FULL_35_25 TaxID=1797582 RepID=A0A1F5EGZ2_9BACT|nr:MAG: hypothetical protein A2442_00245 [Candidatus Campbellbacteria bacterium RIFOXYC2_FULL_35_25]